MATVVTHQTFGKEADLQSAISSIFEKKYNDNYAGIAVASSLLKEVKALEYSNIISFSKNFSDLDMIIQIENLGGDTTLGLTVTYEI